MYAHQVIDSLWVANKKGMISTQTALDIDSGIKNAAKFHFNFLSFPEYTGDQILECIKNIKLPYPTCYFDLSSQEGILAIELEYPNGDEHILYFIFLKEKNKKHWSFVLPQAYFSIRKRDSILFVNNPDEQGLAAWIEKHINDGVLGPLLLGMPSLICRGLDIINCRNIETIDNSPPEKLNKKRIKSGKQPLFTYKTLVIKPIGKKQKSIPRHLWENRIHLCRGHFKTYTEEAPLFGRYTGRFWWQPSVRGRNRDGVVMKDYKIEGA